MKTNVINLFLFLIFLAVPVLVTAQDQIPKKTNTIVVKIAEGKDGMKVFARKMIQAGYEIEKDFELGYVNGIYTKDSKPFKLGLQLKIKAYEEGGKIYVSGDFSIFQTGRGDFNQFDSIAWKGPKKGAWKSSFGEMLALTEGIGELEFENR